LELRTVVRIHVPEPKRASPPARGSDGAMATKGNDEPKSLSELRRLWRAAAAGNGKDKAQLLQQWLKQASPEEKEALVDLLVENELGKRLN
jgi:hypothetical protein